MDADSDDSVVGSLTVVDGVVTGVADSVAVADCSTEDCAPDEGEDTVVGEVGVCDDEVDVWDNAPMAATFGCAVPPTVLAHPATSTVPRTLASSADLLDPIGSPL